MDRFIGRKKELDLLEKWYDSGSFEFVAMYGRRRVGKTAIIKQFLKGKRVIFFSARRTKGNSNIQLFNRTVKRTLGVADDNVLCFDDLFELIGNSADERLVLVIDEFPYFAESNDDIMSALQVFIDLTAGNTKLFLLLCGSSMSFMKRQVLGYESPLYGRRTHEMYVKPMTYLESAEFLAGRTNYEKACIYGAVGGVPMYLKKFSGSGDVFDIMAEEFFSDGSTLSSEPESLLLQELHDPKRYNDVIEAMAEGLTRLNDISNRSGIPAAEISRYMDDLVVLGYVDKMSPINENKKKNTRYYISDNLFRFYYQMVIRKKQILLASSVEEVSENLRTEFPEYMGRTFEIMCAQYIVNNMGYPTVGKWWGPVREGTSEIDVIGSVGRSGGVEGLFAECKFTKRLAESEDLEKLREKAGYVKGFDTKRYAVFSRSGFTEGLTEKADAWGVPLVSLDMMYERKTTPDGSNRQRRKRS